MCSGVLYALMKQLEKNTDKKNVTLQHENIMLQKAGEGSFQDNEVFLR